MNGFAERTLTAIGVDGAEFDLTIRIGLPRAADGDWVCPVFITRLFEPSRDLFGVDSWQALQVSLQLSARLLDGFFERGGRLYWHGSRDPVHVSDLFAAVGSATLRPSAQ